jgi:hypothetical protein
MEEFSDVRFKQRAVIEFLTAGKVPPIDIYSKALVRRFKDGELEQTGLSDKT